jgi:hypothetical protein
MSTEDYSKEELEYVTIQALEYASKNCSDMDIDQQKQIVAAVVQRFISYAKRHVPISPKLKDHF